MKTDHTFWKVLNKLEYGIRCTPRSVLIVDDDDSVRRVFKRVLDYALPACRTDLASNGSEAVKLFSLNHYAVILMDLRMPVMDGDVAAKRIQEMCLQRGWTMPEIVFCTAYTPSESVIRSLKEHSMHFVMLHKPVDNRTLVTCVKPHLAA